MWKRYIISWHKVVDVRSDKIRTQLNPDEVARDVAQLLKDMKPYPTKPETVIPRPPTQPFSGNTNPDAITIRATISQLQSQKAIASQDIQDLDTIKRAALADPEGYLKAALAGKAKPGKVLKEGLPATPAPQNVYRMPPVNWAKYGIVGEVLDKMHEEQRTHPTLGEPEILQTRNQQPATVDLNQPSALKAQKHYISAPYNPLDSASPR